MDSVDYYNKYASVYFENTVNLDMEPVLDRFLQYLEPGDTVLDLGCGSGRDSKIMLDHEMEVTLLDASDEMCQLADIYTGIEPLCMDFRKMDFEEVFDGIWACSSLLHIPKSEIIGVLQKIYNALKKDGIFYLSVKEGTYEGYRHERFFADYTMPELERILQKIPGFCIMDIWESEDVRISKAEAMWVNALVRRIE